MNRRALVITLAALAVSTAVGAGLYAKATSAATPGEVVVAGDVRVDEYAVKAPAITYPTPDYGVGVPAPAGAPKKRATTAPASGSRLPVVSGYLSEVLVAQGAHVTKGDLIARLDTTMLDLGVDQATTARTRAGTDLDALDANLDKIADSRSKLIKARAQLLNGRSRLLKTRASLETKMAVLKRQQRGLIGQIAAIKTLIAQPGGPPLHVPPYPVVLQGLQQGLVGLNQGLAGARTGVAKMNQGLVKMNQGLAQMAKGLSQLDSAKRRLQDARRLVVVSTRAQDLAVSVAKTRRDAAAITAPVDGIVTFARIPGTAVMVGAPIVRIRPDGPSRIYTYLTAAQLAQVRVGSRATVDFDSNTGARLPGPLVLIGDRAVVPPTAFPTPIVHMTRAVRVMIELDDGRYAPPGTPVDVEIASTPGRQERQ